MKNYSAHQLIFLGISAILLIAILPLPEDLYVAINLFAALSGALLVWVAWKSKRFLWVVPGIAAVLLYLPAFNQPFEKATWIFLDLVFIGIFVSAAMVLKGKLLEGD
jgi:predicted membrane channel-forming protein YqfA (hemolysin III family)